jgi:hypothetical protein
MISSAVWHRTVIFNDKLFSCDGNVVGLQGHGRWCDRERLLLNWITSVRWPVIHVRRHSRRGLRRRCWCGPGCLPDVTIVALEKTNVERWINLFSLGVIAVRLGHANYRSVVDMIKRGLIKGMPSSPQIPDNRFSSGPITC